MSEHRPVQQAASAPSVPIEGLLTPSLQRHEPTDASQQASRPWSLDGQLFVAFFGGVLPVTLIAYLNSRRLRIPLAQSWRIIASGIASLCVVIFITALPRFAILPAFLTSSTLPLTAAGRLVALLLYLYQRQMQVPALRIYQWYHHEELASLWAAGLAAVIFLGLLQMGLVDMLAWMVAGLWR